MRNYTMHNLLNRNNRKVCLLPSFACSLDALDHRKPKNEHDFKHLFLILQQEWTF